MSANPQSGVASATEAPPAPEPEVLRVILPTPLGNLGLELTDGVATRLYIAPKGKQRRGFTPILKMEDSDYLDEIFGHIAEYFAGARPNTALDFDLSGHSELDDFSKRVLEAIANIPYGETRTYRQIAKAAGDQDAYRLVLATLQINPIPIIIPCHRVVTNKSGIGSYIGGQKRKRWLLSMEKEGLKV